MLEMETRDNHRSAGGWDALPAFIWMSEWHAGSV